MAKDMKIDQNYKFEINSKLQFNKASFITQKL